MKLNRPTKYEVVIIGGGPAGTSTAIALLKCDPGLRVLIIEKTDYQNFRVGETLHPSIRSLMDQLGIWEDFVKEQHMPSYGTASVWGSPDIQENEFIYNRSGKGWHLDRKRFDLFLAHKARAAGVDILMNSTITGITNFLNGKYTLNLRDQDDKIKTVHADFVVDASGQNAVVAKTQSAQKILYDKLTAAFWVFDPGENQIPEDTYTLVEACEYGWWYSSKIPNNQFVLSFMSDLSVIKKLNIKKHERWKTLLAQSKYTRERVNKYGCESSKFIRPAFSHKLDKFTGDAMLAVGDAASAFDPLSAQGIFKALKSGIFAAYAIIDFFKDDGQALVKYEKFKNDEFENYLQTRTKYYRKEQRWKEAPFWKQRHAHITLNPQKELSLNNLEPHLNRRAVIDLYFSPKDLQTLTQICSNNQSAADTIRQFKMKSNTSLSDQSIILGLQHLCEQGVLIS